VLVELSAPGSSGSRAEDGGGGTAG
jgi:hypothetical protein